MKRDTVFFTLLFRVQTQHGRVLKPLGIVLKKNWAVFFFSHTKEEQKSNSKWEVSMSVVHRGKEWQQCVA